MIPKLFPADYTHGNTVFSGGGIGDLVEAIKVEAEENSSEGHEWELSFEYPETGELFSELLLNRIILAKVNDYQGLQAFRIYSISKSIKHTVTVACQHISYDLQNVPVKPFKEIGAADSLRVLKENMIDTPSVESQATYGKQFTFSTDIPDPEHKSHPESEAEREEITLEFEEPETARSLLFDSDNSVIGKYGGDVIIDNYSIIFKEVGGEDRGVSIDYGVDLVDFEQEKNISTMVTGILPYYVKDKDIDIRLRTKSSDEAPEVTTDTHPIVNFNLEENLVLESGWRYELTFVAENSGGQASLNGNLGIGSFAFNMDGKSKKHEFTLNSNVTILKDAVFFYGTPNQSGDNKGLIGTITNISLKKNPVEPIVYGSIVTRNDSGYEYEVPKYEVPKIQPVNITEYFEDPNIVPTVEQVTSKGQEYVNKENVGIPEVSLTVSYANIGDKEVHLYDAVRVRFVKMGVTVKSKVTRYKYDVLQERVIEIDVGKTKDSAIFTLQDASKLKHGLLKPDRLAKESISGDKLAKNSVKAGNLDIDSFSGGGWHMPADALPDLTGKIGQDDLKTGGWHDDPVLVSVPDNVYGGYHRNVGYLFDPSLGVPPDGMFGWTETDAQGKPTGRFHALIETKMDPNQEYDFNSGDSVVKGMGYVLSPDMIFPASINADKKVAERSVSTRTLADSAVTEEKIEDGAIQNAIYNHNSERKLKAWLNLYDGVGPEGIPIADDKTVDIPYLKVTKAFSIYPYGTPKPRLVMAYSAYSAEDYMPAELKINGTKVAKILTQNGVDVDITVSSLLET